MAILYVIKLATNDTSFLKKKKLKCTLVKVGRNSTCR